MQRDRDRKKVQTHYYRYFFFLCIGFVLITSYQNSLSGPFLFDDFGNIVGNQYISITSLAPSEIAKIFSPNQNSANRKVANLTFALNYYFGQLNPVGFHFINILIHIVNSWLVFLLFQWYFRKEVPHKQWNPIIISGLAALWWATNPIQTNAVTYIVQRMTSLSTLFCLISLLFYLKARNRQTNFLIPQKTILLYIFSGLAWVLAMLSKEIAAILPVIIIAHEIYFFQLISRVRTRKKSFSIVLILFVCLLLSEGLYFIGPSLIGSILADYAHRDFSLVERLFTEPRVVFHYIGLFLYPLPNRLRLYYDTFAISHNLFTPFTTIIAIIGTLFWLASIVFFFKKHRLLSFGLLWTFLTLLIESTIIALELVFEHRFYFPSIGLVLAMIVGLIWCFEKANLRPKLLYFCIFFLISSQILGTYSRNKTWGNELEFSIDEIQKEDDSVRALTNIGLYLIKRGHPVAADKYLQKALTLAPDNLIVLNDLYQIYHNPPFQKHKQAESYLQKFFSAVKAGKAVSTDTQTLSNLAHHLFKSERYKDSLLLLEQESKYYAAPEVFLHIGQCNIQLKDFDKAITALSHASEIEPYNPEIQFTLAFAYFRNENIQAAKKLLVKIPIDTISDTALKNNIVELQNSLSVR